jgi:hypothetical protein
VARKGSRSRGRGRYGSGVRIERSSIGTIPSAAVGAGTPLVLLAGLYPVTGVASDGLVRSVGDVPSSDRRSKSGAITPVTNPRRATSLFSTYTQCPATSGRRHRLPGVTRDYDMARSTARWLRPTTQHGDPSPGRRRTTPESVPIGVAHRPAPVRTFRDVAARDVGPSPAKPALRCSWSTSARLASPSPWIPCSSSRGR